MKYYYDVVLSFAAKDREYVKECADIYSNKAKYAIIFVSQYFVKKRWTKHEFKFINERMIKSETEYLLPVF